MYAKYEIGGHGSHGGTAPIPQFGMDFPQVDKKACEMASKSDWTVFVFERVGEHVEPVAIWSKHD